MTDSSNATPTGCAHCGGVRFRWRVKRARNAGTAHSQRTLVWTCQGCGGEVEEPLARKHDSSDRHTPGAASADAEPPRAGPPAPAPGGR